MPVKAVARTFADDDGIAMSLLEVCITVTSIHVECLNFPLSRPKISALLGFVCLFTIEGLEIPMSTE